MKILGFQNGHDTSYCVLENGIPIIHEELERHLRLKEPKGSGLQYAIDQLKDISDISHFIMGNKLGWNGKSSDSLHKYYPKGILTNTEMGAIVAEVIQKNNGAYHETGHHQAHASNAFYTSPYDEALIVTIDGGGFEFIDEKEEKMIDTAFTVWAGKGVKITPVDVYPANVVNIGSAWSMYTKKIFGLSAGYPKGHQAGTVMAMACVGDKEKYYKDFLEAFKQGGGKQGVKLLSNCAKYKEIADKSEQDTFDIAAGLQYATEIIIHDILKHYINKYQPTNLCLSGGVILNSVAMGKLFDWFPNIKNIFIDPVPYDAGLAIGAARYAYHHILENPRIKDNINKSPYLGITYSEKEVRKAINKNNCNVQKATDEDVLNLLDKQNIISIFHGGAESGRRALGNRSILADPRSSDMKDLINKKVKHRQWYRPFAPSILREDVKEWFKKDIDSPYMSFVIPFRDEVKDKVPAVVHLDGTDYKQLLKKVTNGIIILLKNSKQKQEYLFY